MQRGPQESSHQTSRLPGGTQPFFSQCHTSREVNIFLTKVNIWWTRFWCLLTWPEVCVCGLHGPLQLVWQFIIWKLLHCFPHSGPQLLCLDKSNKDQCYAKIFGHEWQIQIAGLISNLVVYDKIEYHNVSMISKIHNGRPWEISYWFCLSNIIYYHLRKNLGSCIGLLRVLSALQFCHQLAMWGLDTKLDEEWQANCLELVPIIPRYFPYKMRMIAADWVTRSQLQWRTAAVLPVVLLPNLKPSFLFHIHL